MTHTIQVQTVAHTVVGTAEVTLPFYYVCGDFSEIYCCMTAEKTLMTLMTSKSAYQIETRNYQGFAEVTSRLEIDMRDKLFKEIEPEVFMHKFSEAHREVFYAVNPQLKPIA